ncbi:MAG: tRNA (5-methylaminomethyl-2-thiouridine)(34)-methyltransferase MnmD [Bdellovibrionales bacterium]
MPVTAPVLLPTAELDWGDDGLPRSRAFGDVYFSATDGLAETRTVFLGGCNLPAEWQNTKHFTIAELGFGTGLNFLATWQLWQQSNAQGWLHYVSTEFAPLTKGDAGRAFAHWPELAPYAAQLLARWPANVRGPQRLIFPDARITLTLFLDDIATTLPQLHAQVDAWFLDGFAPAKNGAMWAEGLWTHIKRLSHTGTRLGTYTVAGDVRRALQAIGFTVSKEPGFGSKRERLVAVMS